MLAGGFQWDLPLKATLPRDPLARRVFPDYQPHSEVSSEDDSEKNNTMIGRLGF